MTFLGSCRLAKVGTLANSSSSTNRFIQLLNPIVVGGETSLLLELSVNTTCSIESRSLADAISNSSFKVASPTW